MIEKWMLRLCVCLSVFVLPSLAGAQVRQLLTFGRLVGIASLGGGAFFAREAYDYKQKADDLYDEYELATSSVQAEDLYKDVTQNDLRSEIHLVLSVCFAVNGLRLLLAPREPELDELYGKASLLEHKKLALKLTGDAEKQQIGLTLAKRF